MCELKLPPSSLFSEHFYVIRCRRLNLIPLCYLWQRNQAELLDEMIMAGMEAILIKVAGAGLHEAHLGKTLAQVQSTLAKLVCVIPILLDSVFDFLIECFVWLAHLRRGRRIRDLNLGLSPVQA